MNSKVRASTAVLSAGLLSSTLMFLSCGGGKAEPADLVLLNGSVYTMADSQPTAKAVVVAGNKIIALYDKDIDAKRHMKLHTRVIDLGGRMAVPGLIDAHVHFDRAGALINDANLLAVSDAAGLRKEVARVVGIVEDGEWITEGLWGAYEQWRLGEAGAGRSGRALPWRPDRAMIDDLTPRNPCFLCRFDGREWLANSAALAAAGLPGAAPVEGLEIGTDGAPTGIVFSPSPAHDALTRAMKPKSRRRLLEENRAALRALRAAGIVEVHDIETPEQTDRFAELQELGELTCRVWLRPDLERGSALRDAGFRMGSHPRTKAPDAFLRYGALKGYIDGIMGTHGALFFEPYDDQPANFGHWRHHTSDDPSLKAGNMEKMAGLVRTGLAAGFVPNVHAIGDRGVAEMLDLYERLKSETGISLEGFRIIHAQVVRAADFPRFKALGIIAEVNPYHVSDDMRWMEERIGSERCRGAYAFRSLIDNGAVLCFGSDWPGTSAAYYHVHPRYLIYAAVARKTLNGTPPEGWFPEQRLTVEEALRAYTVNGARAAFDADSRGTLEPGKLADITVFDRDLFKTAEADLLKAEVDYTIVDGRVVFER
jgi:predicted amidohydrolase YtcJ